MLEGISRRQWEQLQWLTVSHWYARVPLRPPQVGRCTSEDTEVPWVCQGQCQWSLPHLVGVHKYHLSRYQWRVCFNSIISLREQNKWGLRAGPPTVRDPPWVVGHLGPQSPLQCISLRGTRHDLSPSGGSAGSPTPSFTVEGGANKAEWLTLLCHCLEALAYAGAGGGRKNSSFGSTAILSLGQLVKPAQ